MRSLPTSPFRALREQRRTLGNEENRVSYWRRLIQARMDLIELQGGDDSVRLGRLRMALAETRVGQGRGALVDIMPIDDVPPLPDLAGLWAREADPDDPESVRALKRDLVLRRAAAVRLPGRPAPPPRRDDRRADRPLPRGARAWRSPPCPSPRTS